MLKTILRLVDAGFSADDIRAMLATTNNAATAPETPAEQGSTLSIAQAQAMFPSQFPVTPPPITNTTIAQMQAVPPMYPAIHQQASNETSAQSVGMDQLLTQMSALTRAIQASNIGNASMATPPTPAQAADTVLASILTPPNTNKEG